MPGLFFFWERLFSWQEIPGCGRRGDSMGPRNLTDQEPAAGSDPVVVRGGVLIAIMSTVALSISAFLLWGSLSGRHLPGCGVESGCDAVLGSRWSKWLGVPVSLGALLVYMMVLASLAVLRGRHGDELRRLVVMTLGGLGVMILGAAAWFIILQLGVIHAICPFCMVAHGCGLVVGLMLVLQVGRLSLLRLGLVAGVLGLTGLVAGQVFYVPRQYDVSAVVAPVIEESGPLVEGGNSQDGEESLVLGEGEPEAAAPRQRLLQLHDGLFSLDLYKVPLIGSPEAPTVILHFFDYTCEHCQALHPILTNALHTLGDQVALVNMPIPLEPDCNPIMQRPNPKHTNACDYARIGLALWRAKPEALAEFEDYMMGANRPLHPAIAGRAAERRVGKEAFQSALKDPWIEEYLAEAIRLYHTNYLVYRKQRLPLLMSGTNLVSGEMRTVEQFYEALAVSGKR